MNHRSTTCDGCEADLTFTGNCVDYRLLVTSESIPNPSGVALLVASYPAIDRPHHFCGWACFDKWYEKRKAVKK